MELTSNLEVFLTTCISLRKVRSMIIHQPEGDFEMRPQSHVLIVSPFGTFKSSIIKNLRRVQGKDLDIITEFTKAGITGSISKNGDYVPSVLFRFAGKTMAIDEWNSIDEYGQKALLALLENQEITRALGFSVRTPWRKRGKYGRVEIKENVIKASLHFSCIACAMTYPIPRGKLQEQTSKAILSRYLPVFVESDDKEIFKMISGHKKWNIKDYSSILDSVEITEDCYQEFIHTYWDYINEHDLVPVDADDKGFVTRVNLDVIRIAIAHTIPKNVKHYVIDDSKTLIKFLPFAEAIMRNYLHPFTKGKMREFKRIYLQYPGKSVNWYATRVGVSPSTIRDYANKLEVDVMSNKEIKYSNIRKEVQDYYLNAENGMSISRLAREFDVSWAFVKESIEELKYEKKEEIQKPFSNLQQFTVDDLMPSS